MSELDERMMRRALARAREAGERGEVPVGAVVYETATGRVLAEAGNAREGEGDPSAHAELVAVVRACRERGDWRLSGCTLAVTLEPCVMCAGLLVNARVERVVYGCADPKGGGVETLYAITRDARLNHRVESVGGVLGEESAALLREFFRARRGGGD